MTSVIEFEGTLATPDMIELISTLYSNVRFPDHSNDILIIPVTGSGMFLDGFFDFVETYDLTHLGYKNIIFTKDDTSKHVILDTDYEQNLNDALCQYIDF